MAAALRPQLAAFQAAVQKRAASGEWDDKLVDLKIAVAEAGDAAATRDLYESAALYSVFSGDTASFTRHFALARSAYDSGSLKPSDLWTTVRGLYLMALLVENRLGEFHAELELLSAQERAQPQLAFSITLDQYLAEGRYNKVLDAIQTSLPHQAFDVFVQPLVDAVRGEIAACSATSYTTLPVAAAQRMMLFDSEEELRRFIAASQPKWTIADGVISFNQGDDDARSVPSKKLITRSLEYATELERIV